MEDNLEINIIPKHFKMSWEKKNIYIFTLNDILLYAFLIVPRKTCLSIIDEKMVTNNNIYATFPISHSQ